MIFRTENAKISFLEDLMKDIYISYHSSDLLWVEWIVHLLEDSGYTVVSRAIDSEPKKSFFQEIQQAIQD